MENEVVAVVEKTVTHPVINSWLTSLTTTGLIIVALTVIIFALAKFGVLNKLLDREILKKGLSTGFNKDALKKINDSIGRLLANDEETKSRLCTLERAAAGNTETIGAALKRLDQIEYSVKEFRIESYKKSVFHNGLLLIDRMAAGIRYMLDGGNSETRDYLLNRLCFEDLVIWNGLCKAMNATKFWRNERDRPENWKSQITKEDEK